LSADRAVINLDRVGNTSAASIPLALADAAAADRFQPGQRIVLTAFGGGTTWGATTLTWPAIPAVVPLRRDLVHLPAQCLTHRRTRMVAPNTSATQSTRSTSNWRPKKSNRLIHNMFRTPLQNSIDLQSPPFSTAINRVPEAGRRRRCGNAAHLTSTVSTAARCIAQRNEPTEIRATTRGRSRKTLRRPALPPAQFLRERRPMTRVA